jgi:hypothetical protein
MLPTGDSLAAGTLRTAGAIIRRMNVRRQPSARDPARASLRCCGLLRCSLMNGPTKPVAPAMSRRRHRRSRPGRDAPLRNRSGARGRDRPRAGQGRQGRHAPDIARRFNVGYEEIVRANPGVDPWLPGEGREIVVPTQFSPAERAARRSRDQRRGDAPVSTSRSARAGEKQVVYTHPIGIGKVGWADARGLDQGRAQGQGSRPGARAPACAPSTRQNGEILPAIVPPGPDNPLGTRAMYLGWSTI